MRDIALVLKPCQYCLFRKDLYCRSLEVSWTCSLLQLQVHVQECTGRYLLALRCVVLPTAACRHCRALRPTTGNDITA